MKTATQSHDEFVKKLNELLAHIKHAAESQYAYNLKENIPAKIGGITLDNAAEHAIEGGTVNAIGKFIKWEPDSAILWAHHILEDNNVHTVAQEFWNKYIDPKQ